MYKEVLGKKLKQARLESGYTQEEINRELKIIQTKLSKIESGKQEPDTETLCRLIDFYEVKASWILGTKQ